MSTAAESRHSNPNNRRKATAKTPRKREALSTTRDLLQAARARFARQGFTQTRIADIAADVGVDQALVIRYFRSKEALFQAACSPSPELDQVLTAASDELAQRLLESILSSAPAGGESEFLILIRSLDHEPAIGMLRERLTRLSHQLAPRVDAHDRELRADLVAALLLGIAVSRRLLELPALKAATAGRLAPYLVPIIALLSTTNDTDA